LATATAEQPAAALSFERDIRPILKAHCFPCHGEGESLKGGVDLRLRRLMLTNCEAGTVLVPGKPAESVLLKLAASGEMPKGEKKLSTNEVLRLERWIAQGAPTLRSEPEKPPRIYLTEEERGYWFFSAGRPPGSAPGETNRKGPDPD